ncbi:adenosylcobinamide-GDP ribazoletransferase [Mesorhizobium sp. YM1C-6-2]|uniref:adenosylcobinamide-GDP ribazoletransferase n=1 Tax=Mesorhizobium sp. YM1C-6-2 TaxID=1827501 RepID=UPI000EF1F285|nr:adenosylcobinamide-GDP ribazoletransferase [Mesorhizobium sp. YM1C-6-2]RLP24219.1 adenosylcobinamide-GDP ribazoletransferase [Mesorhizobium sp. YM1C-6-2]
MTPRRIAEDIAFCLVFFTRLPLPAFDFGGRTLAQAMWAAPLVGVAVGVIAALAYVLALSLGVPVQVAAALALAATMLTTGCLHEDGLSDVADGFGGGKTRERKLEIMRDSRIGAYGASALLTSALIRWSAIAALANPLYACSALIAAHAASRALLPAFMHLAPPARQDGLGAGAGTVQADTAYVALAIGAVALLALGVSGLVAAAIVLALVFYGFRALCLRQIGGQTGDTLGALQQAGEIAVLVVAAAILT